jgi:ATP-dependent helicase/nuclease subunit B
MKTVKLSEVETEFIRLVKVIGSSINKGIFPANPGRGGENYNNCVYCDYERVCPSNRELEWEKKSRDALLAEYIDMWKQEVADEEEV